MRFTKDKLNIENALDKEWIITNGIGGYSSSTIIGANTRKYHGLLVAPLTPPARRFLVLSKLDESIEVYGKKYDLYTNMCKDFISKGYLYQKEFEKQYVPVFKYKVEDIEITKIICLEYGKNTVGVYYKIKNGKGNCKLTLAPIINFRDFHTVSINHDFQLKQEINNRKVKIVVDNNSEYPLYMNLSEGSYIKHDNDNFRNMFYIEEEKRGFYPEEDHAVPGIYEVEIDAKQEKEISFIFSLEENIEELNAKDLINKEIVRFGEMFNESSLIDYRKDKKSKIELEEEKLIKDFLITTDNFVVYRPNFGLHTLIAGYPWFLDWGRDTLISFEGLLLIPRRFEIAKEVLKTMIRDVKYGLVPNGYSGYDNRPLYNSVDASLLLFEAIQKYLEYTSDYKTIEKDFYHVLTEIIKHYKSGIDVDNNNIFLDDDGLIVSGTEDTQNTWMDAKYDGIAITPRSGKVVEVNSLWYNANMIMAELSKKIGKGEEADYYRINAFNCKDSFNKKFYNSKRKCLYDVLGDNKIRPNQLFSLSLTYPVVDPSSEQANNIINVVEKKLLNSYGLKTLAKGEPEYVEIYEGDGKKRDSSYHQGITWPWLLGLYYNSLRNMLKEANKKEEKKVIQEKIDKLVENTKKTFSKELTQRGCIGSIAEIYDSKRPYLPKGTIAQGWSVSEIFRIILRK